MIGKIKDFINHDNNGNQDKKEKGLETKTKDQFGYCRVCNDKASGVHYGVPTCEGCKVIIN